MPIAAVEDPRFRLDLLSPEDIRQMHAATLEVIESVGVRFPSARALDILEANGARVDRTTNIARIPGPVIEAALAKAPPVYTLAAADPALDLPLDGRHSYLGTHGYGVEVIDAFSGELHRSTLQDVSDAARVADALEAIAFHWTPISAQDCPPESRSLHELRAIWSVSRKHVQTETIVTAREMRAAVEMLITEGGIFPPQDIMPLAALLSANFAATERIAKLIGEKDFTLLFHKGSRFNIHFGRINQDFILVTLFNNEVSLGLVRLGSIKAIEQMLPVLQAA